MDKKLMGKKSRAAGIRFELKVREDLEKKGWIVDKWSNNVEFGNVTPGEQKSPQIYGGKLVKAKSKWAGPGRPMMMGAGFPDFICYKQVNWKDGETHWTMGEFSGPCKVFENIGVESKMDGKLDKEEKEKAIWLLDNHIFSKILIAKKGKKRVEIEYVEFK